MAPWAGVRDRRPPSASPLKSFCRFWPFMAVVSGSQLDRCDADTDLQLAARGEVEVVVVERFRWLVDCVAV